MAHTPESPAGQSSTATGMARKRAQIGAYSREGVIALLDQRSSDGRFLKRWRADLTKHVGGKPSVTQRILIDRCAILGLRLAKLDEKMLLGAGLTEHDSRQYLAWVNSQRLALRELGYEAAPKPAPTAAEALARHRADKAAQQAKDAA